MQKLTFSELINAKPAQVWHALWDDANYRNWTTAFHEGSYAESDWNEGSDIRFLGPGGGGMFSRIAEKKDNERMSFEHLGVVKDFVNQPPTEETKKWTGGRETYVLKAVDGQTQLDIDLDAPDDFAEYFKESFKKAIATIKQIAEGD